MGGKIIVFWGDGKKRKKDKRGNGKWNELMLKREVTQDSCRMFIELQMLS